MQAEEAELSDVDALPETYGDQLQWVEIFDGETLANWRAGVFGDSDELDFTGTGAILPIGVPISGITYVGEPPRGEYGIHIEATRLSGSDFFLAVTFPVRDAHLTLVLGGWGGTLCGVSSLDGLDASMNDTRVHAEFPNGKRQSVFVYVADDRVRALVNGERLVDVALTGRALSIRPEVQPSLPLGLASFATRTEVHSVRLGRVREHQ